MIKFSQTILLVLLLTACLGIRAYEVHETNNINRAETSESVRSKRAQQYELAYLKNKKNFYRSLSIFSKTAAAINCCRWVICAALCFKSPIQIWEFKWVSKNAQVALGSSFMFFFLSKWLDVEQIALDGQVADLENELAMA